MDILAFEDLFTLYGWIFRKSPPLTKLKSYEQDEGTLKIKDNPSTVTEENFLKYYSHISSIKSQGSFCSCISLQESCHGPLKYGQNYRRTSSIRSPKQEIVTNFMTHLETYDGYSSELPTLRKSHAIDFNNGATALKIAPYVILG